MNRDRILGQWHQLKGQAKQKWGKLTNDDLDRIDGRVEELRGVLQERYGLSKDAADKAILDFEKQHSTTS
ncbi:MAG: CsbD family protein [Planctomycetota bacterium]